MAEIKIAADSGGGSVGLLGPASTTSNAAVQLKLPVADGSANQHLKTDGSGQLGWATDSGKLIQFVNALPDDLNVRTTTSSTSYVDTTLHVYITPTTSTSKIIIGGHVVVFHDTSSREVYLNIHNGTSVASDDVATKAWQLWASSFTNSPIYYIQTAGTTSQMTFSVYFKTSGTGTAGIGFSSNPGSTNTNGHQLWAMEVAA